MDVDHLIAAAVDIAVTVTVAIPGQVLDVVYRGEVLLIVVLILVLVGAGQTLEFIK